MFDDSQRVKIGRIAPTPTATPTPTTTPTPTPTPTPAPTPAPTATGVATGEEGDVATATEQALAPCEPAVDAVVLQPFSFNWRTLPVEQLLIYRDEITQCLPATSLSELNLEQELLLQFHSIRALQTNVLDDDALPLNQRAQVANSVASTLNKLVEMQSAVYSAERFKGVENAMIRTLNKLPENLAKEFLDEYEKVVTQGALK